MTVLTRPDGTLPQDFHVSRRGLPALLAAGYAAIATGADAEPVTTPADGLTIETIALSGDLPGYVARPAAKGHYPAVIVVNEIFGVHEYIKDVCRRFARAGHVAVAPGFFARHDPGNTLATSTDMTAIRAIVDKAKNGAVMADVGTTLDWLGAQRFVDSQRLAITGFCWGGGVVWMAAAKFPRLKAGGAWYGRLSGPKPGVPVTDGRQYPLDIVDRLQAPVLGLYGALDQGIPVSDVGAMAAALRASPNPVTRASSIKLYPNSGHGFHADYRPSYNPVDAADGWARLSAHFKANGV